MTDNTVTIPQYMTVAEVADDLRVSKMTVYRLIGQGHLPASRIGGRTLRIPTEGYRAYKDSARVEIPPQAGHQTPDTIPGQTEITA